MRDHLAGVVMQQAYFDNYDGLSIALIAAGRANPGKQSVRLDAVARGSVQPFVTLLHLCELAEHADAVLEVIGKLVKIWTIPTFAMRKDFPVHPVLMCADLGALFPLLQCPIPLSSISSFSHAPDSSMAVLRGEKSLASWGSRDPLNVTWSDRRTSVVELPPATSRLAFEVPRRQDAGEYLAAILRGDGGIGTLYASPDAVAARETATTGDTSATGAVIVAELRAKHIYAYADYVAGTIVEAHDVKLSKTAAVSQAHAYGALERTLVDQLRATASPDQFDYLCIFMTTCVSPCAAKGALTMETVSRIIDLIDGSGMGCSASEASISGATTGAAAGTRIGIGGAVDSSTAVLPTTAGGSLVAPGMSADATEASTSESVSTTATNSALYALVCDTLARIPAKSVPSEQALIVMSSVLNLFRRHTFSAYSLCVLATFVAGSFPAPELPGTVLHELIALYGKHNVSKCPALPLSITNSRATIDLVGVHRPSDAFRAILRYAAKTVSVAFKVLPLFETNGDAVVAALQCLDPSAVIESFEETISKCVKGAEVAEVGEVVRGLAFFIASCSVDRGVLLSSKCESSATPALILQLLYVVCRRRAEIVSSLFDMGQPCRGVILALISGADTYAPSHSVCAGYGCVLACQLQSIDKDPSLLALLAGPLSVTANVEQSQFILLVEALLVHDTGAKAGEGLTLSLLRGLFQSACSQLDHKLVCRQLVGIRELMGNELCAKSLSPVLSATLVDMLASLGAASLAVQTGVADILAIVLHMSEQEADAMRRAFGAKVAVASGARRQRVADADITFFSSDSAGGTAGRAGRGVQSHANHFIAIRNVLQAHCTSGELPAR